MNKLNDSQAGLEQPIKEISNGHKEAGLTMETQIYYP